MTAKIRSGSESKTNGIYIDNTEFHHRDENIAYADLVMIQMKTFMAAETLYLMKRYSYKNGWKDTCDLMIVKDVT